MEFTGLAEMMEEGRTSGETLVSQIPTHDFGEADPKYAEMEARML